MMIRQFMTEDIVKVQSLLEAGKPYVVPYREYVYWILARYCKETCFVAEQDNAILGFLASLPSPERECLFVWQIVSEYRKRGKGIGMQLLEQVKQSMERLGLYRLEISVDPENAACNRLLEKAAALWDCQLNVSGKYQDDTFSEIVYFMEIQKSEESRKGFRTYP